MRVQQPDTGREFDLEAPPVGSGGEAAVFAVGGQAKLVAKIYHKPNAEHAEKLAAMLAAPPDDPMAGTGHASIAWPSGILVSVGDRSRFVGFLMPRIDHAYGIHEFYIPKNRQQRCPLFHYGYLMRTARNLAAAVRAVHERGYVVGDLSGSNLLVTSQALVTLIDTDSFQVPGQSKLYRCRVSTPEYTPPELHHSRLGDIDRQITHDAFGLAVLIFQLLMQGTHPFAGLFTGQGEPPTIPKRIVRGHWPYAASTSVPFKPNPHAPPWEVLSPALQTLFVRCFHDGHAHPEQRPTASDWQQALHEAEKQLTVCPANAQHQFFRALPACPWCALAKQHGRDPFPSFNAVKEGLRTSSGSMPILSAAGPIAVPMAIAVQPAAVATHAGPIPVAIPVQPAAVTAYAGPIPVAMLAVPAPSRQRTIDFGQLGRRLLKGVIAVIAFLIAAGLVAWGSWKLTHHVHVPPATSGGEEKSADQSIDLHDPPTEIQPTPSEKSPASDRSRPAVIKEARLVVRSLDKRIDGIALTADGNSLLASTGRGMVQLRDLKSGDPERRMMLSRRVVQTSFARDADRMLVLYASSQIMLWNVTAGRARQAFEVRAPGIGKGRNDRLLVNSIALSPDGNFAVALNFEKIVFWNAETGRQRELPRNLVLNLDVNRVPLLSESGQTVLFHCTDGAAVVDTAAGRVECRLENGGKPFHVLALSLGGKMVLAVAESEVTVRDAVKGTILRTLASSRMITSATFSRQGGFALLGDDDGDVHLWNLRTGKELAIFTGHEEEVSAVAFGSSGKLAVSADAGGTVRLWEMPAEVKAEAEK